MKNKTNTLLVLFLSLIITTVTAQEDSVQNLYFVRKNSAVSFGENDYQPGKKAFYIYRNCVYDVQLKNKRKLSIKVIDIRNDSIYYTLYHYKYDTANNRDQQDTLHLHPSELKKIWLIGDRIFAIYSVYSLTKRRYVFEKDTSAKTFEHQTKVEYSADSSRATTYELVPYLTQQGPDMVYEQCGVSYYYEGFIGKEACADTTGKNKAPIIKKWVWFTPSNANKISGVNISLVTMSFNDGPLTINGVNLDAGLLSFFLGFYALFNIPFNNNLINMEDSVDKSDMLTHVTGLSLSAGGLAGDLQVKGVSINGGFSGVTEAKGLVISGTQNITSEFHGMEISGLLNKTIKGRGVQVGLLNICKDMKGIQIGLWNVNSKRKLPFINWNF
jgi:hypothetical protein